MAFGSRRVGRGIFAAMVRAASGRRKDEEESPPPPDEATADDRDEAT